MKRGLILITWLLADVFNASYAVDIDEDEPVVKPTKTQSNAEKVELERVKNELAAEKRRRAQLEADAEAAEARRRQEQSAAAEAEARRRQEQSAAAEAKSREKQQSENAQLLVVPNIEMVRPPSGIAMGKYEVTQGQWRAVMGSNPSEFTGCGDNCPVERVSWNDVQQFIQRLSNQTGKRYRLPSEYEWFGACQAGDQTKYCGSNIIDAVAWYGDNTNAVHSVGQKQANAWGLYDMSGNVCEWTSSCLEKDCSERVFRGGSYLDDPLTMHSGMRTGDTPSSRNFFLGFRLTQDP